MPLGLTLEIGRQGEDVAASKLSGDGFEILHRNWRKGRYELDIVARKDGILHFVEVKCRKKDGLTSPEDAINGLKFRSLRKAASAYIAKYGIDLEVQFDLVTVLYDESGWQAEYIPCAMTAQW